MMPELMTGPLGLIVVAAVIWWGITFNRRLEERYHCTACTFWGITGGIVGFFCWLVAFGSSGSGVERFIVGSIALVITLALFFSNRAKAQNTVQGVLMTVWQLLVGFTVMIILNFLDQGKKKKRRE